MTFVSEITQVPLIRTGGWIDGGRGSSVAPIGIGGIGFAGYAGPRARVYGILQTSCGIVRVPATTHADCVGVRSRGEGRR